MAWSKVAPIALLTMSAGAARAGDNAGFGVDISLSAKAASELTRLHEGIVVAASY
jgi:hypothetical protein